jgi:hypothetical protein
MEINEGTNFELACKSHGSPIPTIKWESVSENSDFFQTLTKIHSDEISIFSNDRDNAWDFSYIHL